MEMKKKLIVLFSLMLVMVLMTGCFGLFAESKINSQLDKLASGMKNMDTDKISSTFASEVEINSDLGSTTVSKSELVDLWEDSFQTMKNEGAEYIKYKYTNRTISVSGDTATAAVTEELEIEYSDGSTDSNSSSGEFGFIKEDGEWLINKVEFTTTTSQQSVFSISN